MTLPFAGDHNKRMYQCFVCGKQYKEYDVFKEHIVSDHEEGREYIMCPLERCQAPVRDLKAHFKVKHPTTELPKVGPNRAMIWKDPSGKNLKTRKPSFRDGYLISEKMNGQEMHYRSGYECEVYECLEALDEVAGYKVEPFKIPYLHQGKPYEYIPDLLVQFADGHYEVWEVKPASQTALEKNEDKWRAANDHCKARGWNFTVITEVGIGKLKRKVAERRQMK